MMEDKIKHDVVLAPYTTFKIGGKAEMFAIAKTEAELLELARFAAEQNLPVTILGGGSNVLISDDGITGLVIKVETRGVDYEPVVAPDDAVVTVGAGMSWDELVRNTTEKNLWGLENLSGIPGTVGGAIVQNINAYGVTIADMVSKVTALHLPSQTMRRFAPNECGFEYRNSWFKQSGAGRDYAILKVSLRLSTAKKMQAEYRSSSQSIETYLKERDITEPTPSDMREAILHIRSRIGMLEGMYQSAGSFFKNPIVTKSDFAGVADVVESGHAEISAKFTPWHWPVGEDKEKISAAFLMECTPYNKTNFAGQNYNGTVGISPVHTLSVINLGNAGASDVREFTKKISDTIEEKFGITFESEVRVL